MTDFSLMNPILSVIILLILLAIMVLLYLKLRVFLAILVVYCFSLIIGMNSISMGDIPFSPYFQTFFLVFQSVIFLITAIKVYKYDRE